MRILCIIPIISISFISYGNKPDTLISTELDKFRWFIEQTTENLRNKVVILQKDSTIIDLNKIVTIMQGEVASLKRDSASCTKQNITLLAESTLYKVAYQAQDKAVTQLKKEKLTLKGIILGLAALVVLSLVHPW